MVVWRILSRPQGGYVVEYHNRYTGRIFACGQCSPLVALETILAWVLEPEQAEGGDFISLPDGTIFQHCDHGVLA